MNNSHKIPEITVMFNNFEALDELGFLEQGTYLDVQSTHRALQFLAELRVS